MSKLDPANVLRAGGLVAGDAQVPDGERTDTVVARAYRHPALSDRVVVRLSAEALVRGDDIEMKVLGFGEAEDRGVVGKQRHRVPGFPGWALIHDPDHAEYALQVMEQFKREARRAGSKPGHAKTGIDSIADTLGRSVPHFLPSFYEEAGRVFLAAGAASYAAQCFGKAREAERVHALEVDEEQRAQAFLEFALAGAVTIKALGDYAKELSGAYDPEPAYRRFARLCVQRTLGGLPPWGGMARELRRLAKAAKLDQKAEERALLVEIIDSPALTKAAGEFWKVYQKPLLALAAESASARGALLNLFPTPSNSNTTEFDGEWLDFLEKAGALEALWNADAPAEARPTGGPAAWFSKLVEHTRRGWRESYAPTQAFTILRKLAPTLIENGEPISVSARWGVIDVDLADLAVELGVPIKYATERVSLQLEEWAKRAKEPERGRDPEHLLAHPELSKHVDDALDDVMGNEPFESVSRGKPAVTRAKRAWLERRIAEAASGGLPALNSNLHRLSDATTERTFAEIPDLHPALASIDCAPPLARTLRGGLFDEIGWDAFDDAVASLDGDEKTLSGTFPYAVVFNKVRAIAVGPEGRVFEHDFKLPKGSEVQLARYVQGQLLVVFRDDKYDWRGYWSSSPSESFPLDNGWNINTLGARAVTLADGAVCEGGRALSAGDTSIANSASVSSDGETVWTYHWNASSWVMCEIDPRTGKTGRKSRPRFLEEYGDGDWKLDDSDSWILPLPGGVDGSLIGSRDGFIGWRERYRESNEKGWAERVATEVESIDGRRWTGLVEGSAPVALVRLPGDEAVRPVTQGYSYRSPGVANLYDPTGEILLASGDDEYHKGTELLLPPQWWALLCARDPAGSEALRRATDEDAAALLACAIAEVEAAPDKDDVPLPKTDALISELLPAITNERLRQGVLGIIAKTAGLQLTLRELARSRDPAGAELGVDHVVDTAVYEAMRSLFGYAYLWHEGSPTRQMSAVSSFLARAERGTGDRAQNLPSSSINWPILVAYPRAMAFFAASFALSNEQRAATIAFLRAWAESIFADPAASLRRLEISGEELPWRQGEVDYSPWLFEHQGNDYFVRETSGHWKNESYTALEYAPDGNFKALPQVQIVSENRIDKSFGRDQALAFLELLEQRGPVPWDPAIVDALGDRTGLTRPEAALLWAGLPRISERETNFLPKEVRTTLNLKVAEANAARETFKQVSTHQRAALYQAAIPADAEALWNPLEGEGSPVAALSRCWVELFGKRASIPTELIVAADKAVQAPLEPVIALSMIAMSDTDPRLNRDGTWRFKEDGELERVNPEQSAFDPETLHTLATYLPYLFAERPVGDPIRGMLPAAYARAADRLASDELLLVLDNRWFYSDDADREVQALLDGVGGDPMKGKVTGRDAGSVVATCDSDHNVHLFFRPVYLSVPEDWDYVGKLIDRERYFSGPRPFDSARLLLSDGFAAMAARVAKTPVPEGAYEANPLFSAPELVKEVGGELDLSEDACVLYLQTLALLAPTSKSIQLWNGWKAARYKKAAKELCARELLLEAKRSRAGRSFFLPGGWEALKAPHPPLETWKLPLYGLARVGEGAIASPLPRYLPLRPLHEIFAAAWERVKSGDAPAYEEVNR